MKIALIYPAIVIDGFAKPGEKPKTGWIHHGLCYLSAALKAKGHSVSLVDLRSLTGWEEFSQAVKVTAPDVACITMMSLDFDAALKAANIVKKVNAEIKIVMGGAHPSLMESELLGNSDIDYIFKGEAEVTFPKVLESIADGSLKTKVITGEAPDLDKIPFVDRTLFRILEAPITPFLKMPFITAIAGRGCTYNCNFCQPAERKMFGPGLRRMSAGRFIEELEITRGTIGLNSLMIHDDCLVEDSAWVEKFLKLYSEKKFNKPFVCQSRVDIIVRNPKLFKDMKKQGLAMLLIGFESGSQRVLNFLRKGTTVEQNLKAADVCKRFGIRIWANFMLGIPTETKNEVLETITMIKRIKPYTSSPAFYTPHPGSDLFKYCIDNDLSLITKHEEYKRTPTGRKIKGVDYEFLRQVLDEELKVPFYVKLRHKIDRLRIRHFNKELIANHSV